MENSQIIKIKELVKIYPLGARKLTALRDINLSVKKGEFTGVVGPSGSGKTTLLNIIGALDHPTEGYAEVLDHKIESLTDAKAAQLRNQYIGFIFQSYNLLPIYTVFENVELPLLLLNMDKPKRKEMVKEALDWLGILDKIDSKPSQLSGGERQRVSVARAMVKRPKIVLADEPTANLDSKNAHNILQRMHKLNEELKTTFIFATHDYKVIQYVQRKIVLEDGQVSEDELKSPDR